MREPPTYPTGHQKRPHERSKLRHTTVGGPASTERLKASTQGSACRSVWTTTAFVTLPQALPLLITEASAMRSLARKSASAGAGLAVEVAGPQLGQLAPAKPGLDVRFNKQPVHAVFELVVDGIELAGGDDELRLLDDLGRGDAPRLSWRP